MECAKKINGNICGDSSPGENNYGDCNPEVHVQRSICRSSSYSEDTCGNAGINTVADCAAAVSELITQGICHENGLFESTLCGSEEFLLSTCVCQLAGSTFVDYQDRSASSAWAAQTVYRVKGT